ncbi:hypothetical protein [Arthrobacter sp. UYEF20]|uniref:hypothetical protein n=1 Tax=Arthrobacter sp. UYEF20 TaxID=1756363 RepID=UPI003396E6CD
MATRGARLGLVPFSLLTAQAGEQLEKSRPASALVNEHAQEGDVLKVASVIVFVIVVAMIVASYEPIGRRLAFLGGLRTNRGVGIVLLVAGAAAGAFFIYPLGARVLHLQGGGELRGLPGAPL